MTKTGSCLCGAVSFEVRGELRPVIACHCGQCRKQTGTYMSATVCADSELVFPRQDGCDSGRGLSQGAVVGRLTSEAGPRLSPG